MGRALPSVTVAIPTYNRADSYLRDALDSAVSQSYPNLEILVSDNCSTDNTEELVRGYRDSRIRYVRQQSNIGMLRNENYCVQAASGHYFQLLCDDDMIDSDFVESCIGTAGADSDVGVILTGTRLVGESGVLLGENRNTAGGLSTTDFFRAWLERKVPLYMCSTLYNTAKLRSVGGFHSRKNLYEDNVALFKLAALYGRVDIEAPKASFRLHGQGMGSVARLRDWCDDSLYLLDVMCSLVPDADGRLRREGMRSLCRQNYYRTDRLVRPRFRRLLSYLMVYGMFGYCYSPVRYVYRKQRRRALARLQRAQVETAR
jgi:glycosyltransferase involved in cell wall biosynthesis